MEKELTVKNLYEVEYDEASHCYYLEFVVDGEAIVAKVSESDCEDARSDEDYFESEENLKAAIENAQEIIAK